jgi:hypothetical protein
MPGEVKTIKHNAFQNCQDLQSIAFSKEIENIEE